MGLRGFLRRRRRVEEPASLSEEDVRKLQRVQRAAPSRVRVLRKRR